MAILNTVAQFGRYMLRSRIADASACEVWIAEVDGADPGAHPIIFKKLRSNLAQIPSTLECFIQRARDATLLEHDCIAKVLDVVTLRSECGLAMEYVDGKSLRQLIRAVGGASNALPVWFAIHVARCICQALECAHEFRDAKGGTHPIFHGTLTPENVFLTFSGCVKVTDFGTSRQSLLASAGADQSPTLQSGIRNNAAILDPVVTDLDGVGRILYELLTGICPPTHDESSTVFLPPSHYAPWVNLEVDQLLSRMLSPKDSKRLSKAVDVRKALDEYLCARRHDVTATHIAGLVSVLFSEECRESGPPTARIHENAVELAILRSRRTNPPDFPAIEAQTQNGFKQPAHSAAPNSQMSRQTLPSPGASPFAGHDTRSPPVAPTAPANPPFFRTPPASVPPARTVEPAEATGGRTGPFHHDWDLALRRAREEVEANQRASGTVAVAGAVRPEPPMDPVERAVLEFERGLEHMRHGEFELALKCWERALEFDPQHRVCRANLNLLKKKLGSAS